MTTPLIYEVTTPLPCEVTTPTRTVLDLSVLQEEVEAAVCGGGARAQGSLEVLQFLVELYHLLQGAKLNRLGEGGGGRGGGRMCVTIHHWL